MQINISFIVIMIFVLALIIIMALMAYKNFISRIIKEKHVQHQLELQHQKNITTQNIKVQEEERERIAIRLHDDISNKLNVLSVWLNNPKTWNSNRSRAIILKQVPDLIETTRSISHSLFPVNIERFGLETAIEELIASVSPALSIEFTIAQGYQAQPKSIEIQIYRIIQEFLNNVLKHAKANTMGIHIRDSKKVLALVLSDNGKGFNTETTSKGMGLRNMEMRLKAINAQFKWKSKINQGSLLIFKILKT